MTHDDLDALADAVGVLHHPEPPMTWRDIATGAALTIAALPTLILGGIL